MTYMTNRREHGKSIQWNIVTKNNSLSYIQWHENMFIINNRLHNEIT